MFVGLEYPEFKKQVLGILKECQYDPTEGIVGDYKQKILEAFKDNKK